MFSEKNSPFLLRKSSQQFRETDNRFKFLDPENLRRDRIENPLLKNKSPKLPLLRCQLTGNVTVTVTGNGVSEKLPVTSYLVT